MKSLGRIRRFVLLGAAVAATQPAIPKRNPAPANQAGPKGNVVDWGLKQINPRDIDYGQRVEELRQTVIDSTIHDYGFWTDFVVAGVLGMMFLMVFWQDRQNRRMRFSNARVVTAYYNELAMARDQINLLSSEYAQVKEMLDERREASFVSRPQAAKRDNAPASNSNKDTVSTVPDGQPGREQLLTENGNLKQQVKTLTAKWQEEQQKNRKLKGE
jgi:hypothetical protein